MTLHDRAHRPGNLVVAGLVDDVGEDDRVGEADDCVPANVERATARMLSGGGQRWPAEAPP
jgi:hypothetical protein